MVKGFFATHRVFPRVSSSSTGFGRFSTPSPTGSRASAQARHCSFVRRLLPILLAAGLLAPLLGAGAGPAVAQSPTYGSTISLVTVNQLWASWRPGCPLPPDQLRRVTVDHWGFDGAVHTGVLIVHADLAGEVAAAFGDLFAQHFPIHQMVPVEAFNGSDDASMAANNTSAFNCRAVTGGSSWSRHAFGRAIDINPVQNPYVSGSTVLPSAGRAHLDRSPAPGRILAGDGTVAAFAGRGWTWGGNWNSPRDYQHFERAGSPVRPIPAQAGAAVASPAAGTVELVWRSPTGSVLHRRRTVAGWSAASNLGGYSASTPDLTTWGDGRLDAFVLGSDGAIWHRHRATTGGAWTPWASLGGGFRSGPAAVSWAPGRIDVFGRGLDDALWTNAWTGTGWTGWRSLGGRITSDPDVASWAPGRLDVFARGVDGAIWHRGHAGGAWFPWDSLGGTTASGPGVASRSPGRIDIFAVGSDGALYGTGWAAAGWTGWYGLGGLLTSDPDVAAEPGGPAHVVASGGDGALWSGSLGESWSGWAPWPSG